MMRPRWGKQLDVRAVLVFQRLHRFYSSFGVLAALISALALAVLSFNEFHPTVSPLSRLSEGFLCSSAMTAVISAVVATMLMFQFEGHEKATRRDLAVAWLPLIFLDLSVVEFLVGLVSWHADKNVRWRGALMETQLLVLVIISVLLAWWIWIFMKQPGGLGREESEQALKRQRVADD
ncbi:hypothetical protein VTN77DRAFT_585 [Rasamsonia byssochlamydoides]|uniref:uncharacterized protein n=1 Tax=Rasamsonia byssochlamydoides TaxID=89139 RepID=UPI0037429DD6